jgi:hypothetical protein
MKAKIVIGIVLFLMGVTNDIFAQATAYANIFAEVIAPVGIEKTNDLTYLDRTSSSNNAAVVLQANNPQITSAIDLTKNGSATLASFSITGNDQTFDVTLPSESFTISDGNAKTMVVGNFNSTYAEVNTLHGNIHTLKVGATLHLPLHQAAGNYGTTAPFQVTLNYN